MALARSYDYGEMKKRGYPIVILDENMYAGNNLDLTRLYYDRETYDTYNWDGVHDDAQNRLEVLSQKPYLMTGEMSKLVAIKVRGSQAVFLAGELGTLMRATPAPLYECDNFAVLIYRNDTGIPVDNTAYLDHSKGYAKVVTYYQKRLVELPCFRDSENWVRPFPEDISLIPDLPEEYNKKICDFLSLAPYIDNEPLPVIKQTYGLPPLKVAEKAMETLCDKNIKVHKRDFKLALSALANGYGDLAYHLYVRAIEFGNTYLGYASSKSYWHKVMSRNRVSVDYLYSIAEQYGFSIESKSVVASVTDVIKEITQIKIAELEAQAKMAVYVPEFVDKAPKLIKDIATWIDNSSIYPQPNLSMAAAISTVSFCMGRDFCTQERNPLKPNLYIIGIANTTAGKETAKTCMLKMFHEVERRVTYKSLTEKVLSGVSGGSALQEALVDNDGWLILMLEECSFIFNEMLSSTSSSQMRDVTKILLEIFTTDLFITRRMAKSNLTTQGLTQSIRYPAATVYGLTQKEPFFSAINAKSIERGELNRMIFIEGHQYRPRSNAEDMFGEAQKTSVPLDVMNALVDIREKARKNPETSPKWRPIPVEYDQEAKEYFINMQKRFDEAYRDSEKKGTHFHKVCGRYPELVKKLSMVGAASNAINITHVMWAKSVMEYSNELAYSACDELVGANEFTKSLMSVLDVIKRLGSITKQELSKSSACKRLKPREMRDIMIKLEEMGCIHTIRPTNKTPLTYVFRNNINTIAQKEYYEIKELMSSI